jgi:RNA polymerase sigma-70 factor (ECF subfamily)
MRNGDEMAWRAFSVEYFSRLWRYLLVTTAGDEDLARESLQAALARVARHIKEFGDEAVFWSWLTVLARTACADERKKRRRYRAFLDRFRVGADEPPDAADADERLNALLGRHLAALPPDERELIEQKYFQHRSVAEIAAGNNATEKAVESKLSRIRRKLKEAALQDLNDETEH